MPFELASRASSSNPTSGNGRNERQPAVVFEFNKTFRILWYKSECVVGMVCLNLVCCITTDKVEKGKRTTWMSLQPFLGDFEEMTLVNYQSFTSQNTLCNRVSRPYDGRAHSGRKSPEPDKFRTHGIQIYFVIHTDCDIPK